MADVAAQCRQMSPSSNGRAAAHPPLLSTTVTREEDRTIVSVTGELDLATAPALQREVIALCAPPVSAITLDLERLAFIDSSGLSALNAIRLAAVDQHLDLYLRSVPDQALRVLDITGMAELFARTNTRTTRS